MDLATKRCVPCDGDVPPLDREALPALVSQVPGWRVEDGQRLARRYKFQNFLAAMTFVNQMAELAEDEQHHPDFCVRYDVVDVSLTTHAAGGLTENDFILAAKLTARQAVAREHG